METYLWKINKKKLDKTNLIRYSNFIKKNYKIKDSINLGSGKSRSISDVISILQKNFKKIKMIQNNKDIPFESSEANMDKFYKLTRWLPENNLEKAIPAIIKFEKSKKNKLVKKVRLNILITSSSKKIPLIMACISAAKKINKNIKVICGDINKNSISKYVSNSFWKMPISKDMNFQLILDGCLKRNIKLIIPTRDQELLFWSKFKNKLILATESRFPSIYYWIKKKAIKSLVKRKTT